MLPPATQEVFDFLCSFQNEHGYIPSLREMAEGMTYSRTHIGHHLDLLHAYGYIHRERYRARCIVILRPCQADNTDAR